jgi:hypothetical protein
MIDYLLWAIVWVSQVVLCAVTLVSRKVRLSSLVAFSAFTASANVIAFWVRHDPWRFDQVSEKLYLGEAILVVAVIAQVLCGFLPRFKPLVVYFFIVFASLAALLTYVGINWASYYVAGCTVILTPILWRTPTERECGDEYTFLLWSMWFLAGSQRACALWVAWYGKSWAISRVDQICWIAAVVCLIVAVLRFGNGQRETRVRWVSAA